MNPSLSRLTALRDVASQVNSQRDLDSLLPDLIRIACQQGEWNLGAIMAVDLAHGFAQVLARHNPTLLKVALEDRWELATSPSLVALQRGEPVFIRDAQVSEEFPGYRRDATERGYRTVLVFPMSSIDLQGRPMVLTVSSRKVQQPSAEDLAFMSSIIHLGAIAVERAHRHREDQEAAEQTRRALSAQGSLLRDALAGSSLPSMTDTLCDMLNSPVLVIDLFAGTVFGSASPLPTTCDDLTWRQRLAGDLGRTILTDVRRVVAMADESRPRNTRSHSFTVFVNETQSVEGYLEPLSVDAETVGALVTFGAGLQINLHRLMIDSAKFALSVQLMRSVIQFRFETRTLTELFFEVVERRWRDETDILNRARRLHLDFSASTRMLVIDYPHRTDSHEDRSAQSHRVAASVAAQLRLAVTIVTFGGGLACLLPGDDALSQDAALRFSQRLTSKLTESLGREPIAVLGEVYNGLAAVPVEWERCWRMIRIARTFGRSGTMSAPDLGPLPILVGAADSADIKSFVDGMLAKIIEHDKKSVSAEYVKTLTEYIRSGCRNQACADAMGLHVTTLRYRLSRISDLFGIDLETPEKRFAVELALNFHHLVNATAPDTPVKPVSEKKGK